MFVVDCFFKETFKMNKNHRYFVQYMLQNGVATVNNAFSFCKRISNGDIEDLTQFKTLIIELNREISKQFYKIAFSTCEVTNEDLVVWLNTRNDDISKLQITYSALELEYFHSILQEILNSDNHRITFIVCINITSTLTGIFSRDNGQKVLNKWLKGGYYIKNGDFIYLGPRIILEFTTYLRSHCPDSVCNLCSELVFTGSTCGLCHKTLHSYCLTKFLINQDRCPCCKNRWTEANETVGENNLIENDRLMHHDENETLPDMRPSTSGIQQTSNRISKLSHMEEESSETGPSQRKLQKYC